MHTTDTKMRTRDTEMRITVFKMEFNCLQNQFAHNEKIIKIQKLKKSSKNRL